MFDFRSGNSTDIRVSLMQHYNTPRYPVAYLNRKSEIGGWEWRRDGSGGGGGEWPAGGGGGRGIATGHRRRKSVIVVTSE